MVIVDLLSPNLLLIQCHWSCSYHWMSVCHYYLLVSHDAKKMHLKETVLAVEKEGGEFRNFLLRY